jgi:hypothetical protein
MNERIKELYNQALEPTGVEGLGGSYMELNYKKFAELIVQECTGIAKEIAFKHQVKEDTYSAGKKAGAFEVAEGIKQHFGVE